MYICDYNYTRYVLDCNLHFGITMRNHLRHGHLQTSAVQYVGENPAVIHLLVHQLARDNDI